MPQPDVIAKWAANAPLNFVDQYIGNLRQYHGIAMDVGDQDGLRIDAGKLHDIFDRYGLANAFEIYHGTHTSAVSDRIQNHVLPFFSKNLCFEKSCHSRDQQHEDAGCRGRDDEQRVPEPSEPVRVCSDPNSTGPTKPATFAMVLMTPTAEAAAARSLSISVGIDQKTGRKAISSVIRLKNTRVAASDWRQHGESQRAQRQQPDRDGCVPAPFQIPVGMPAIEQHAKQRHCERDGEEQADALVWQAGLALEQRGHPEDGGVRGKVGEEGYCGEQEHLAPIAGLRGL